MSLASSDDLLVPIESGTLTVRLARGPREIDAVQALRYRVFYEEMGAIPCSRARATRRDRDDYDEVADHLIVTDTAAGEGLAGVVGAYRLIRREAAARLGRFYSQDEYDISCLLNSSCRLLELGRSCVDAEHRGRAVMQLLWRGIAAYVAAHGIEIMFGCASLPGTDPDAMAEALTYLHHHHLAPPALRPRALDGRRIGMARLDAASLDPRRILAGLPPLIKGYLRLGGFVGEGAVIDRDFNTTDVAVIVKTDLITERYSRHYDRQRSDPE